MKDQISIWQGDLFQLAVDAAIYYHKGLHLPWMYVVAVLDPSLISIFLYDICFKKYANKRCYILLFWSYMPGPVFPGFHQFVSSLLFCSSSGLLFRIMNDGTANNFLKYEKAVILFNFSSLFFEPQVSYFNSKNIKYIIKWYK